MAELRWRLADAEQEGQQALFGVDELAGPQRGTGRLSGLEFLHVAARRVLNPVPASSRMPFRWTINVYRGCSHACAYCLVGDTPILMIDGRVKAIADVRAGDEVFGTERRGDRRHLVATPVLAHWQTTKQAHRIVLADGTTLIASADHRFLTGLGWRHITAAADGGVQRPHLTTTDQLVGIGHPEPPKDEGVTVEPHPGLRVVAIEPVGVDVPMFDITTGTGDFMANGVVSHNCFARPTHEYLGLNLGEDFDRKIVVKINAVEKLRAELAAPTWTGDPVAMGTNTDPYQRAEGKYRLTRGVVEALGERHNSFSILTKSALVTRDLDLLVTAARHADVTVNFSVPTVDEAIWRATEPGTPHPRRRLDAMRTLAAAGIRTGVLIAPILPGLSDRPEQIGDVVRAVSEAGGNVLGAMALHLRAGTREHFMAWLAGFDPVLHANYLRRYAASDYAPPRYADRLDAMVTEAQRRWAFRSPQPD